MGKSEQDVQCEKKLARILSGSLMARLLMSALEKAGCPVSPHRHFACEECSDAVDGGTDC